MHVSSKFNALQRSAAVQHFMVLARADAEENTTQLIVDLRSLLRAQAVDVDVAID